MGVSLLSPLHALPLAFIDVETTGASADFGHRVTELGICRVEGGRVVAEYQQLVNPRRRLSPGVVALTGITQEMVAGQPLFADIVAAFEPLLRGAIIVGHNVRFDLSFINDECRAAGRPLTDMLGDPPVLDTVRIARRRFGRGGNGLQSLARRFCCSPAAAHRALADAVTTYRVFDALLAPVGGWNLSLCDLLVQQGGPMKLLPAAARESLLPLELEEALEARKPVRMDYVDANQRPTSRVILPVHVRRFRGELLLVAHCQLRNAQRTFKLDRIVQLTRVDEAELPNVQPC